MADPNPTAAVHWAPQEPRRPTPPPPPMPNVIERDVLEDFIFPDPPQKFGEGVNGHVLKCYLRSNPNVMFAAKRVLVSSTHAEQELRYWSHCQDEHEHEHHIATLRAVYRCQREVPGDKEGLGASERYFIISEPLLGGDVFDEIVRRGRFSELDAQNVVREMALALRKVHRRGVAHRDLKPENFVFRFDAAYLAAHPESPKLKYKLRLIDFGFAKWANRLKTPVHTWGYAPPEIAQRLNFWFRSPVQEDLLPYTLACDMWSLGVIIFIILCGYPPFNSRDHRMAPSPRMDANIRAGNFAFNPAYWAAVSDGAKDLISKLIVVEPGGRLTIDQALEHPWLAGPPAPDTPLFSPMFLGIPSNQAEARSMFHFSSVQTEAHAAAHAHDAAAGPAGVRMSPPQIAFQLDPGNAMERRMRKRPAEQP